MNRAIASSSVACKRSLVCGLNWDKVVRVEDKFLGGTLVKVLVAFGSVIKRNDCGIDRPGDLYPVVQDRVHQLAMVAHDRALSCREGEGLGPAQTNANTKLTDFGMLVDAAWITRHIETRNTYAPGSASDAHDRVQYRCRRFTCTSAMTARLKADTVDGSIDLRLAEDLLDLVRKLATLREIDGFTAETACLLKSLFDHIADDDNRGAKQLRGG